jgi:hypothetical protein
VLTALPSYHWDYLSQICQRFKVHHVIFIASIRHDNLRPNAAYIPSYMHSVSG